MDNDEEMFQKIIEMLTKMRGDRKADHEDFFSKNARLS
jgi:hypothetical protein